MYYRNPDYIYLDYLVKKSAPDKTRPFVFQKSGLIPIGLLFLPVVVLGGLAALSHLLGH